jgi:GDPmannose 4,6-dehydratase
MRHPAKPLVAVDPRYFRPAEVEQLLGDPSKAKAELGWEPKVGLSQLVEMMVDADVEAARKDVHLQDGGFTVKDYHE